MIGNCYKLTVIFVAGNPFVDEAWLKIGTQGLARDQRASRVFVVVQQCQHHGYEVEIN